MAIYNKENLALFTEHNENCAIGHLIEWIADLLTQSDFDSYVAHIKSEELEI